MEPTTTISKAKLNELLNQNEAMKADIKVLKSGVTKVMSLMGLIDEKTQSIKPEIESGEESFVPGMLKSLGDVVLLLTKASRPDWMGGKKSKEELGEKFSFVTELIPVIKKYSNGGK